MTTETITIKLTKLELKSLAAGLAWLSINNAMDDKEIQYNKDVKKLHDKLAKIYNKHF